MWIHSPGIQTQSPKREQKDYPRRLRTLGLYVEFRGLGFRVWGLGFGGLGFRAVV